MPKKPTLPPDNEEKIFDFSIHRGKGGRVLASWKFNKAKAEEAIKNTAQEKGSDLIGSLFDMIKKKLTGSTDEPEDE